MTCTKLRHLTEDDALRQARRLAERKRRRGGRDRWPVHAYRCPHCGFWHFGHARPPEERRPIPGHLRP